MDDYFFASDPWSAFYHPAYSQPSVYSRRRPFMSPAASPSSSHFRPVASPAPAPSPSAVLTQKPRVVSIPVRYVDDRDSRRKAAMGLTPSEAATRIQRVFRGFFVRRMVVKVSKIAAEVDAMEEIMASESERDKIQSEPRERLRVGETLMALLLRLDSVVGVREYRRKVIRRVIRLQEIVDSIPAAAQALDAPTQTSDEAVEKERWEDSANDEALEEQESLGKTAVAESAGDLISDAEETTGEETVKMVDILQEREAEETIQQEENSDAEDVGENQSELPLDAAGSQDDTSKMMEACEEKHVINGEFKDCVVVPMDEEFSSSSAPETANKDRIVVSCVDAAERDTALPELTATAIAPASVEKTSRSGGEVKDVVEKVMAESAKLQQLVAALCERNTQQCQLIAGLVSRVNRLEQTVQKMENKKKKKKRLANSNLASPVGKKNNQNNGMSQFML